MSNPEAEGPIGLTELQELLDRNEQHKRNYKYLKRDYEKLQNEYLSLQGDMKQVLQECNEAKETFLNAIDAASESIRQKEEEILEIKTSFQETNFVNLSTQGKKELHLQSQLEECQEELGSIQRSNLKLSYEIAVLKSELENSDLVHDRALQEVKLKHQVEMEALTLAKEGLQRELVAAQSSDLDQKYRLSQKENGVLNRKLSALTSEMEELMAERERKQQEKEASTRSLTVQMNQHLAHRRMLESEKSRLLLQKDSLEKDLIKYREENVLLSNEIQASKHDSLSLSNRTHLSRHNAELQLADAKINFAYKQAALEKDLESANLRILEMEANFESAKKLWKKQEMAMEEKLTHSQKHLEEVQVKEKEREQKGNEEKLKLRIELEKAVSVKNELEIKVEEQDEEIKRISLKAKTESEANRSQLKSFKSQLVNLSTIENTSKHYENETFILHQKLVESQRQYSELTRLMETEKKLWEKKMEELEKNQELSLIENSSAEKIVSQNLLTLETTLEELKRKNELKEKSFKDDKEKWIKKEKEYCKSIYKLQAKIDTIKLKLGSFIKKHEDFKEILNSKDFTFS